MQDALGYLVLLGLAGALGVYVFRSYAKMTPRGTAAHFGLAPGETVQWMWVGELADGPSLAAQIAVAAASVIVTALVGAGGVATLRSPGITVLITSQRRLVLVREREDGTVGRAFFTAPGEVKIELLGAGDRAIQGGPSARFRLTASDGRPFDVLLHGSAVALLERWIGGALR
jgi:hypothetical protein